MGGTRLHEPRKSSYPGSHATLACRSALLGPLSRVLVDRRPGTGDWGHCGHRMVLEQVAERAVSSRRLLFRSESRVRRVQCGAELPLGMERREYSRANNEAAAHPLGYRGAASAGDEG